MTQRRIAAIAALALPVVAAWAAAEGAPSPGSPRTFCGMDFVWIPPGTFNSN